MIVSMLYRWQSNTSLLCDRNDFVIKQLCINFKRLYYCSAKVLNGFKLKNILVLLSTYICAPYSDDPLFTMM